MHGCNFIHRKCKIGMCKVKGSRKKRESFEKKGEWNGVFSVVGWVASFFFQTLTNGHTLALTPEYSSLL